MSEAGINEGSASVDPLRYTPACEWLETLRSTQMNCLDN